MRRRTVGGLVLAGCLAATTAVSAAAPTYLQQVDLQGQSAFHRWNGGPAPKAVSKGDAKAKPGDADKLRATADGAAAMRSQEEANLLRRIAVIDRIKELALETGNTKLEEQAAELEKQAATVYRQRTSDLPIRRRVEKGEQGDNR